MAMVRVMIEFGTSIAFGDCLKNYGRTKFKVILPNDVHIIPIIRLFRKQKCF